MALYSRPSSPELESVRTRCLDAALAAYEDAGMRGLCADGRWEAALDAIRRLDLSSLLQETDPSQVADRPVRRAEDSFE
jgi:hypothetical protein